MKRSLKEIVKHHRTLSGLSQAELAKHANVGKTVVFDLEHGKESIQLDTLLKILSVLNITIRFESPVIERMETTPLESAADDKPTYP